MTPLTLTNEFNRSPCVTVAQRAEIQRLLRRAEYDTTMVTYQFRAIGVAESMIGLPVDHWIDTLHRSDASAVINRLRESV